MGIEFLLLGQLAIGAATTIAQVSAQRRGERAQREARDIRTASETFQNRLSRRQSIREARIRRAQISNAAAVTGTAGSSGEIGANSAVGASLGGSIAEQQRYILVNKALSDKEQEVSDANYSASRSQAFGTFLNNVLGFRVKQVSGQFGSTNLFGD